MEAEDDLITIRNWDMCHYCCITAPPADPGNSCHAFLRRPRVLCSRCSVSGMRFLNLRIHGACAPCEKTSSHFIISHIPLRISSALAPCFFCNDLTVAAGIIWVVGYCRHRVALCCGHRLPLFHHVLFLLVFQCSPGWKPPC